MHIEKEKVKKEHSVLRILLFAAIVCLIFPCINDWC